MLEIFSVTFPFFALVLCGYIAVRRALLPQAAIPGLNAFVLFFALPCLLYRFGARTPLAQLLDPGVALVYLVCALLTVGLTLAVTLRRVGWNDAAFGALVAAFPNTGFMGVPLLLALRGPSSSGPLIISMAIDLMLTTSLCVGLSRLGQRAKHGSALAIRNALVGMAGNPMPWAILLGAASSAFGLVLPKPVNASIGLLADAASPVALFAIGAVLARAHLTAHDVSAFVDVWPVALIKLLVQPLLMLAIGHAAIALGLALARPALTVMVLLACLPSAGNVAMLAERYGASSGRIARIVLWTTALSFLSFSAAVAWLD